MATLEELYARVLADDAERAAFAQAAKTPEGLQAFLARQGCDATPEDVADFLKERQSDQGEIADEELGSVAGGCNGQEAVMSIFTVGVLCAGAAIYSSAKDNMTADNGVILCAEGRASD